MNDTSQPFLTDVKTLRERARQHNQGGPVTPPTAAIRRRRSRSAAVLATELVCVLRSPSTHRRHRPRPARASSRSSMEHAADEQRARHAGGVAESTSWAARPTQPRHPDRPRVAQYQTSDDRSA